MKITKYLRIARSFGAAAALGLVSAGLVCLLPPRSLAADAPAAAAGSMTQPFIHLYSDANGVSHFRDETLVVQGGAGGHARLVLSQASGAQLLAIKLGQVEDWHRAPLRMYLIVLKGMSEVTAGDGQMRRFAAGSVMLMDDLTGKGHITRAVGTEDHVALTVPAPAAK